MILILFNNPNSYSVKIIFKFNVFLIILLNNFLLKLYILFSKKFVITSFFSYGMFIKLNKPLNFLSIVDILSVIRKIYNYYLNSQFSLLNKAINHF